MPLEIIRADITAVFADAIVNSANPLPVVGRGVDSRLHDAAGPQLLAARERIGALAVGEAVATEAGALPARYVIHTVGPLWEGGSGEAEALAGCYRNSLNLALSLGCGSVAFPLISTGTYGFPKDLALWVATRTIGDFLAEHDLDVMLVVYDPESYQLSEELFGSVQSFIDEHFEGADRLSPSELQELAKPASANLEGSFAGSLSTTPFFEGSFDGDLSAAPVFEEAPPSSAPSRPSSTDHAPRKPGFLDRLRKRQLEDVVNQVDETFSEALLRMIDERGLTDPEVYKRANIDRKLFSKIRSNPAYQPSKATAVALAVALQLSLDETRDLIGRAGYALTHASKGDLIVEYFIEQGVFDIFLINETLFAFDQALIGR